MPTQRQLFGACLTAMAISLPLNGLFPVLPIGELRREGFFHVSAIVLLFYILSGQAASPLRGIGRAGGPLWLMLPVAVAGYFANADVIHAVSGEGRSGSSKFLTASLVFGYFYLFTLALTDIIAKIGVHAAARWFCRGIVCVSTVLSVVLAFETVSWFFEPARSWLALARSALVDGRVFQPFRLSGLSYEPSFNAFYLLFSMPWLAYLGRSPATPPALASYARLLLGVTLVFLLLSSARTAYAGIALCSAYFVVCTAARRAFGRRLAVHAGACFLVAAPLLFTAVQMALLSHLADGGSMSNLARLASVQAALGMYAGHPVFGVGLGQFGILYEHYLPSFGWASREVAEFAQGQRGDMTAPSYNMFTLVLAELGTLGLIVWLLFLRGATLAIGRMKSAATGPQDAALLQALDYMIVIAVALMLSIGSFRPAQIWLPVAFVTAMSISMRNRVTEPAADPATAAAA